MVELRRPLPQGFLPPHPPPFRPLKNSALPPTPFLDGRLSPPYLLEIQGGLTTGAKLQPNLQASPPPEPVAFSCLLPVPRLLSPPSPSPPVLPTLSTLPPLLLSPHTFHSHSTPHRTQSRPPHPLPSTPPPFSPSLHPPSLLHPFRQRRHGLSSASSQTRTPSNA